MAWRARGSPPGAQSRGGGRSRSGTPGATMRSAAFRARSTAERAPVVPAAAAARAAAAAAAPGSQLVRREPRGTAGMAGGAGNAMQTCSLHSRHLHGKMSPFNTRAHSAKTLSRKKRATCIHTHMIAMRSVLRQHRSTCTTSLMIRAWRSAGRGSRGHLVGTQLTTGSESRGTVSQQAPAARRS